MPIIYILFFKSKILSTKSWNDFLFFNFNV